MASKEEAEKLLPDDSPREPDEEEKRKIRAQLVPLDQLREQAQNRIDQRLFDDETLTKIYSYLEHVVYLPEEEKNAEYLVFLGMMKEDEIFPKIMEAAYNSGKDALLKLFGGAMKLGNQLAFGTYEGTIDYYKRILKTHTTLTEENIESLLNTALSVDER